MNNIKDQLMGVQNQQASNLFREETRNELVVPKEMSDVQSYKERLRGLKEVQDLTGEIEVLNPNSIILFGQKSSEGISKVSDEILNTIRDTTSEEASEMLVSLTKIMDRFDLDEITKEEKVGMLDKFMKKVGKRIAEILQKYDSMGADIEKIYNVLKKYENDINQANNQLKRLYEANHEFYLELERYIVAGEIAMDEIDAAYIQIQNDLSMDPEYREMLLANLNVSKEMLSQRIYDLQIAENVSLQSAPMIRMMQMTNFNLQRKINSSFIITLPIFKQCLAKAIMLKRQQIQANGLKQLDDKTNELLKRNAAMTAQQSVNVMKMASTSSIEMQTLENTYSTIMNGIEETKRVQEEAMRMRKENTVRLEQMKRELKDKFSK